MKPALMFAKALDYQLSGKGKEAKDIYKKLLRAYPDRSEVLGNLAVLIKQDGLLTVAENMLKRAVTADRRNFSAYTTLANICLGRKDYKEAARYNKIALDIEPNFPDALVNDGVLLIQDNRLEEAEAQFWRAMQLDPRNKHARMNFANIRRYRKINIEGSIDMLKALLEEQPESDEVQLMLCFAYQDILRIVKALESASEAVRLSKGLKIEPLNALATVHMVLGELEEASALYEKSRQLDPDSLISATAYLFTLNYDDRRTPEEVIEEYRSIGNMIARNHTRYDHSQRARIEGRKIRIGYSSPDLYSHVVSFFIDPILRNHDKSKFEVYAYANVIKPDDHTIYLKKFFDKWVDVLQMTDQEVAQKIKDDNIDIMIDLAGHTYGHRLGALAYKPAPIQATYLGFGYTTGMEAIDYFIGDKNFTPEGCEPYFVEKILRIDEPVYAYNPPRYRIPEVAPLPALEKGYVTFGTMSRMIRLNSRLLTVWREILERVPGSKLRFDQKTFEDAETIERFTVRLEGLGYRREQIELHSTNPHWDGYHQFDIALDCWPHNAGTTTFEALYLGVPVVSKRDRPSVGRLSDMVMSPLGLGEWVVDTEAQFVEKAVALASDLPKLAEIRQSLRPKINESTFLDFRLRTRNLEAGYLEMVRRYNEERS